MQLPFDSHMEGSRVRFKVDKAYQFGLGLDNSELFLVFECVLLDKKFLELEPMTFLRLNFAAAYHDGCFSSVDPHTDTIVLLTRLPLEGLEVPQVVKTMEKMLNVADRITRGELAQGRSPSSQTLDFFSQVRP